MEYNGELELITRGAGALLGRMGANERAESKDTGERLERLYFTDQGCTTRA